MTLNSCKILKLACSAALIFGVNISAATAQTNYNSSKLPDIILNAYTHHPKLKSLQAGNLGARETIIQARAASRPQVSFTGGISAARRDAVLRSGSPFKQNSEPRELALTVDQTIFDGGRNRLLQENAALEFQISKARYEEAATAIAAEIIEDYIELMSAIADVDILGESVTTLEGLEKSVLVRREAGESTKTELALSVSRLASARAQRATAIANLNLARDQLLSKTGYLVQTPELPVHATVEVSFSKDELTEMARVLNPAIRASKFTEQNTLVTLNSEKRKYLPTVSLTAQAQTAKDTSPTIDQDDSLSLGINFTVPLYSGGANSSKTRQALAERNAAKFNTMNVIRESDLIIHQLWSRLESGKVSFEAQAANVRANAEALEGITRGEAVGLASTQDVLEAIQNRLSAELTYSRAQYDLYTTRLLLKLYIGQFDVHTFD